MSTDITSSPLYHENDASHRVLGSNSSAVGQLLSRDDNSLVPEPLDYDKECKVGPQSTYEQVRCFMASCSGFKTPFPLLR